MEEEQCAPVISLGVQEYSQSAAVAHFEAVQLDEEDGKVSPRARADTSNTAATLQLISIV